MLVVVEEQHWIATDLGRQLWARVVLKGISTAYQDEFSIRTAPPFVNAIEGDVFTLLAKSNESEQHIELAPAEPIGTFLTSRYDEVENLVLFLLA